MAIGQASTFSEIPLSVPLFQGNEWKYLKECLDAGWVSSAGSFVDRFEREITSAVEAPYAVATVNGTAALHIALKTTGLEPEEEVLVSDLTFIAPVNAIRYCGAHPVLVDSDPSSWQMDTERLEQFLQEGCVFKEGKLFNRKTLRRVRTILPVHILGLTCEIDRIAALASQFRLSVVEDAAEALGVRYQDRHVGTFGDVGVLSFNGNKVVTAGGGGMLVTRHKELARCARYLTTQAKDDDFESIHHEIGYNYRLTNLQAALGVAQLEQLPAFLVKKRWIAQSYADRLKDLEGLTLMPVPSHTEPTFWLYTVLLPEGTALSQRNRILMGMREQGIGARPLWHPIHGQPPYQKCEVLGGEIATDLYHRGISLPSSVGLSEEELTRCVEVFRQEFRVSG
ncbi:MAG: LegC family aminotransferase [Candidatus Omnitrophica bacterium]|nr:LegC family aminotransferase [Candidatus Omnitrophota bacterium]